jgi:hypothetical protein
MANYVLGPRAARWLQTQMNGHMTGGRSPGGRPCSVDEQSFCHPFELRWAASAGGDSGGAPKGAWIIWLPNGSLVVDGSEVDFSTLAAASGYPAGWYDLTESFGDGEVPEEFDLYLQPGAKAEFGIDKSKLTDPVLVASVKGKMVKGVVESALVFSASGAPHPWELRRFVKEPETSGGDPVVEWRVWIPVAAITFMYGSLARKVVADSGTGDTMIVSPSISSAMWGCGNYSGSVDVARSSAAAEAGLEGKWAVVDIPDGGGAVYLRLFSPSTDDMPPSTVELVSDLPGKDATVSHPVSLTDEGFYFCIARVDEDGVITQCVCSMLTVSHYTDGVIQKMIAGGDGIRVTEENGRITITATGGGGSSGGDDVVTSGYSGTVVAATNPRYDEGSHRLLYTPVSMKFEKGLMKSIEMGAETVIAQAVEESA